MRIIVCIKQVPGTSKVEMDAVTGVLKRSGVDSKMNPYDLYALETAFQIRERVGGSVKVISMGPPQAQAIIKEAYMMGADEGYLVSDSKFAGSDVLATSFTLSQAIRKIGGFELIICGKQTTDGDTAQVGPELAEFLGIPHVAWVRTISKVSNDKIIVEQDLAESYEVVEMGYPCLITVEKDIYQPRLPSYKLKLDTAERIVKIFALKDFEEQDESRYGLEGSPTQVERIFPPEINREQFLWEGAPQKLVEQFFKKLQDGKFV